MRIEPAALDLDEVDPTLDLEGFETNPESVEQTDDELERRDLNPELLEFILELDEGPMGTLRGDGSWVVVSCSEFVAELGLFFILSETLILETLTPSSINSSLFILNTSMYTSALAPVQSRTD